jgi:hypothetical protein
VSAQFEKVIADLDTLDAQYLLPDVCQLLLDLIAGRTLIGCRDVR